MSCSSCGEPIDPERLEALPETRVCIACARAKPEGLRHDPNDVCAKSSPSGQNGWSPSD